MIIIGATNFPEALDKYVLPLIPSENITAHIFRNVKVYSLHSISCNWQFKQKRAKPSGLCFKLYACTLSSLFTLAVP